MIRTLLSPSAREAAAAAACAVVLGLAVAGCQPSPPTPPAPPIPPAPATPAVVAPPLAAAPTPAIVRPSMDLPPGPIYLCEVAGARTPIEFPDNVEQLCRRHPEMGPCQYERDACRRRSGRVYTSLGDEVTTAIEAEYDRSVRRVRFQSDGPGKR